MASDIKEFMKDMKDIKDEPPLYSNLSQLDNISNSKIL